jgi:hypothetical protein
LRPKVDNPTCALCAIHLWYRLEIFVPEKKLKNGIWKYKELGNESDVFLQQNSKET